MFQLQKKQKKIKKRKVKLLPLNLANEELEVFDGGMPSSSTSLDEPIVCKIEPDIHSEEMIVAPYLVICNLFN